MNAPAPPIGLLLNYRDVARSLRCLRSLLDDGLTQVLVWDNSEDAGASARALRAQVAGWPVEIVESPVNLGFAIGVNRALEHIAARQPAARVLLINNDACLLAGGGAALEAALDAAPAAWIAHPDIDHAGRVLGPVHHQRLTGLLSPRPLPAGHVYASGCCLLIDLARLPAPTLFDEDFFIYGEDIELGWRLGDARRVHLPRTLVWHEGSASSGLGSPLYERRMVAAHWLLARKLARGPVDRFFSFVLHAAMLLLRALRRSLRHRSLEPWRALRAGWRLARGGDPQHARALSAAGGRRAPVRPPPTSPPR